MIKEIEAKSILTYRKNPATWFGVNYNMNIYRGCQFQCIYCDSRSDCYRIENFKDIEVKVNAVQLLEQALRKKRRTATIGTGAMSDPYMPVELTYQLTRQALEVIDRYRFRVMLATKSNNILRDIDILERIARRYACVGITITTADDDLGKMIEPGAPTSSERFEAIGILAEIGVDVGILMQPQLPFIMETEEHVEALLEKAAYYKAKWIYPSFGMTLRSGQREYYYEQLDELEAFKGLSDAYKARFKSYYGAGCKNYKKMKAYLNQRCRALGIMVGQTSYEKRFGQAQLNLFEDYKEHW